MARRRGADDEPATRRGWRRGVGRLVSAAALLAVGWFVVEGGEYGTRDLWHLRGRIRETRAALDSIGRVVDSLALRKQDVQRNPAVQERIAREEFGMVKGDKEIVYHLLRPDTAVADSQ